MGEVINKLNFKGLLGVYLREKKVEKAFPAQELNCKRCTEVMLLFGRTGEQLHSINVGFWDCIPKFTGF